MSALTHFWPTAAEAESLRFVLDLPDLRARYLAAGAAFAAGALIFCLVPPIAGVGLGIMLVGHLPLWVRRQTTAPGGATPDHEEVWAPTEDDWTSRVVELERQGDAWDASPWDVTCWRGFFTLLAVVAVVAGAILLFGATLGFDAMVRLFAVAAVLLLPLWVNGIRTTWNPSELRLKGEALDYARSAVTGRIEDDFDVVPMLALREGKKGKYPVDARMMLRPSEDDGSGFLGVQVQVALNNVQGTDYPYLYCVVLGKEGFRLPRAQGRHRQPRGDVELVTERGDGDGVSYLVIRQHADEAGGWHTEPEHIAEIMRAAIQEARRARRNNLEGPE